MRRNTLITNSILSFAKASFFMMFFLFAVTNECIAQVNDELHHQNRDEIKMKQLRTKWDDAQGTFQIQIVNSRKNPQVDVSVIEDIIKSRKKDEIVYLPLMEEVRIMILPYSQIQSSEFKKIELYKYVSE